jgi:hypothetical protein
MFKGAPKKTRYVPKKIYAHNVNELILIIADYLKTNRVYRGGKNL